MRGLISTNSPKRFNPVFACRLTPPCIALPLFSSLGYSQSLVLRSRLRAISDRALYLVGDAVGKLRGDLDSTPV
jgi:hypothetical protein